MVARTTLLVVTLAVAGACASTHYDALTPEAMLPDLARLRTRADQLRNERGFVTVGRAGDEPIRLAYRHIPADDDEWLVVALHGVLADSGTWDYFLGALGGKREILLIDFPGCGKSDKPDPELLPPEAYTPDDLARQVLLVIRARVRPGQRIAVVGHSLGTLVILRMLGSPALLDEFAAEIAVIERAILFAPVDFAIACKQPVFEKIAHLSNFEVSIGRMLGILDETVAKGCSRGAADPDRYPREAVDRLIELLDDPARLEAAQYMLRRACPFDECECLDWDRVRELVAQYRNVTVPCLLVPGARDATFPCAMGYKLLAQLPKARLHVIEQCGHAVPTEAPEEAARLVDRFLDVSVEGYALVTDGVVPAPSRAGVRPSGPALPDRRSRIVQVCAKF